MENQHIYQHNDVFTTPGKTAGYLESIGTLTRQPDRLDQLVGTFAQLHVAGSWPRAVNLWEGSWPQITQALRDHDTGARAAPSAGFEEWARTSAMQRTGGFDRFLYPGPGSPDLASIRASSVAEAPRSCVVQLDVSVRQGAAGDYVQWFSECCVPAVKVEQWRALMWFSCIHSARVFIYFASPSWLGVDDLAQVLPEPLPGWNASTQTSFLKAWSESHYLSPA
jgi:hypothetical protein